MHFHRDLLIIADGYAKEILGVTPDAFQSPPVPDAAPRGRGRPPKADTPKVFIYNLFQ